MAPQLPISDETHAEKYRQPGETHGDSADRQARALADGPDHEAQLKDIYRSQRFLNAGRIQSAAGSFRQVTAFNCFVMPTIHDSMAGIFEVLKQAALTMKMGGGVGYDFSTIRPRGDNIASVQSPSSGPVSFMDVFNSMCRTIMSAGSRRGAMMGCLRIDHPDIEEFVEAKANTTNLTNFNVSVLVTDEFMEALYKERSFPLRWNGKVYREIDAVQLWHKIMRTTWDWAEPGVLFIDRMNQMNNLWYCEEIAATNPCGEQPLPPYGACLLGSFNLTQYVRWVHMEGRYEFQWKQLAEDIPPVVRALDNVIDRTIYPLPEQEEEAKNKRRMGIGVTGVANTLEALGYPYGSDDAQRTLSSILGMITNQAYLASAHLAAEKGSFPMFDPELYLQSEFVKTRLDPHVWDAIYSHGIRNSHLTSIAPTGTISLCADNVSSGIEPTFSKRFERTIKEWDGERTEVVEDYGVRAFGIEPKTAAKCRIEDHLGMLSVAQEWVDSSCAKTINLTGDEDMTTFSKVYLTAWEMGAKGCTTFNPKGKRFGILNPVEEEPEVDEGAACYIDPESGKKSCE